MAMQLNNNLSLPFELKIISSWNNYNTSDEKYYLDFTMNKNEAIDCGIELKEYKNFKVAFKTEDGFSNNLKINKFIDDGEKIEIKPNHVKSLSSNSKNWVPDEYLISIEYNNQEYYSSITVKPKNMTDIQLKKMRIEINKILEGTIYNLKNYKKLSKSLIEDGEFHQSDINLIDELDDNFNDLSIAINKIINSPITKLEKAYQLRRDSFKVNEKSMKWLSSNKARSINNSIERPEIIKQKKMVLSIDNKENKWLIKIIDYVRRQLRKIENKLNDERKIQNRRLGKLQEEIEDINQTIEDIQSKPNSYLYENDFLRNKKRKEGKRQYINNTENLIELIDENLNKINKLISQIAIVYDKKIYTANKDFHNLKSPTKKLLRDRRYKALYDFYKELISGASNKNIDGQSFEYRSTEELYEYYILINIIRALIELGYDWHELDEFNKRLKNKSILNINEDTIIIMESEDYLIEVNYEQELSRRNPKESKITSYSFQLNFGNLKPDFRIDIYKKSDTNEFEYVYSFVIEVKYRTFDKLYNEDFETEVYKKLCNYKGRIRVNPGHKIATQKVLVTYPEDKYYSNKLKRTTGDEIVYIQLSPDQELEEQFGYDVFFDELESLIP